MKEAAAPEKTAWDPLALVREHQKGVWRYLRALGCDPATADDVTQDTFLAVLEKPFEDYCPAATAAYLRRVAHNRFISLRRRLGKVVSAPEIDVVDTRWAAWAGEDQAETAIAALKECLGRLTERARWALEMRFRDQLSRVEIAENLQITEHGAKNLMQRAKQQLRECVEGKTNAP